MQLQQVLLRVLTNTVGFLLDHPEQNSPCIKSVPDKLCNFKLSGYVIIYAERGAGLLVEKVLANALCYHDGLLSIKNAGRVRCSGWSQLAK